MASCARKVKQPLRYIVTNDRADSVMEDIYIPDTGNYMMKVRVKFLSGFQDDKVKVVLTGIPANITVTPDTFIGTPTFDQDVVLRSNGAMAGEVYPVTITGYTETVIPQSYTFNVRVIPADCAALFWGNINGSNICTSRTFAYTSTGVSTGTLNMLTINNFGGYGPHCNVQVSLNCNNGAVTIAKANYGNGVVLSGSGVFTSDSMTINYFAESIPSGGSESCTVVYKR
jgi:hypothetical protein